MSGLIRLLAVASVMALVACDAPQSSDPAKGRGFDFYVLALSWSPSYCEAEGERTNPQQCDSGRPYGFIVHGLWPQFDKGFPKFCDDDPEWVKSDIENDFLDIMPSRGLIRHQWKKHGTCAGLSQDDYFATLRAAHERVSLPDLAAADGGYRTLAPADVESAFQRANPDLQLKHFAVTCDRRRLREVRICMTVDLEYRSCPEVNRRACRRSSIVVPPSRGGS